MIEIVSSIKDWNHKETIPLDLKIYKFIEKSVILKQKKFYKGLTGFYLCYIEAGSNYIKALSCDGYSEFQVYTLGEIKKLPSTLTFNDILWVKTYQKSSDPQYYTVKYDPL